MNGVSRICYMGPAAKHLHRLHDALQAVEGLRLASPIRKFPRLVCGTGKGLKTLTHYSYVNERPVATA